MQEVRGGKLDAIFPIENILSITVRNIHGKYQLTNKELSSLKSELKLAKYTGGLLEKPGHVFLEIKLKKTKFTKSGYVYASKGYIHFDKGTDFYNKQFSGSYELPNKFDFDKFK